MSQPLILGVGAIVIVVIIAAVIIYYIRNRDATTATSSPPSPTNEPPEATNRPCVRDSDCSAEMPKCLDRTCKPTPAPGKCYDSSDCSSGRCYFPVGNAPEDGQGTCGECAASSQCSGTKVCFDANCIEPSTVPQVSCVDNTDCAGHPTKQFQCFIEPGSRTGTCSQCMTDSHCSLFGNNLKCGAAVTGNPTCQECHVGSQCDSGRCFADLPKYASQRGKCAEVCSRDSDCTQFDGFDYNCLVSQGACDPYADDISITL